MVGGDGCIIEKSSECIIDGGGAAGGDFRRRSVILFLSRLYLLCFIYRIFLIFFFIFVALWRDNCEKRESFFVDENLGLVH